MCGILEKQDRGIGGALLVARVAEAIMHERWNGNTK